MNTAQPLGRNQDLLSDSSPRMRRPPPSPQSFHDPAARHRGWKYRPDPIEQPPSHSQARRIFVAWPSRPWPG